MAKDDLHARLHGTILQPLPHTTLTRFQRKARFPCGGVIARRTVTLARIANEMAGYIACCRFRRFDPLLQFVMSLSDDDAHHDAMLQRTPYDHRPPFDN